MEQEDKDVVAKFVLVLGVLVILAAVAFLVAKLASTVTANATRGAESDEFVKMQEAEINERIKPVGMVTAGEIPKGPIVRSGKEIVEATCRSCHGAGVLGAPKIGDTADWGARFGQGMATLIKNAANGKGGMPPLPLAAFFISVAMPCPKRAPQSAVSPIFGAPRTPAP